jgi:hypothetical protein
MEYYTCMKYGRVQTIMSEQQLVDCTYNVAQYHNSTSALSHYIIIMLLDNIDQTQDASV